MRKGKTKLQKRTLTKIDTKSLKLRTLGVSQHATGNRGRFTANLVKPVQPPLASPPEPTVFNVDPLNFSEGRRGDECGDDDDGDDIARGYYANSVSIFCLLGHLVSHPCIRIIR